jgi:phosphinothricin acetyltransferase
VRNEAGFSSVIRLATRSDAEAIRAIYAPVVERTATSFEEAPPSVEEIGRRIGATLDRFPWLVFEEAGAVRAYAYAGEHRQRAAYRWSVDVSIYVAEEAKRRGLGRALYAALFDILRTQGFRCAFAGITLPNPASVGLHEAMGFTPVGVYRSVGFKLDRWHDVGWWQLPLGPFPSDPGEPVPFRDLRNHPAVAHRTSG